MNGRTIRTDATRTKFLTALSEAGNVSDACRKLGLHRSAIYAWKAHDPMFAAAWDIALQLGG
jgi:transposase-like protein